MDAKCKHGGDPYKHICQHHQNIYSTGSQSPGTANMRKRFCSQVQRSAAQSVNVSGGAKGWSRPGTVILAAMQGMLARRERETDVRESAVIGEAGSWH
ncbi:hypothetical protein MCOR13_007558 [Pyricularia oryzae]|nr:hypothetical protein MCOR13_007558 [Pyricularia oryzae]